MRDGAIFIISTIISGKHLATNVFPKNIIPNICFINNKNIQINFEYFLK